MQKGINRFKEHCILLNLLLLFHKTPLHCPKNKQKKNNQTKRIGKRDSPHSLGSTAEEIHTDVARVAFQRVHANRIELPIKPSSDKVSVACEVENKN